MKIIGLTGGIASGKSTVSAYLKSKGIPVIDADVEAKKVLDIGSKAYFDLINAFSDSILNEDKTVNRKKLAAIVFKDKKLVARLNEITHPRVVERTKAILAELAAKNIPVAVIDAPLLIEAGLNSIADEVWVVYTSPELQIERAMQRDNSTREQVTNKMDNQLSFEEKLKYADHVITNDGTLKQLYVQVDGILAEK